METEPFFSSSLSVFPVRQDSEPASRADEASSMTQTWIINKQIDQNTKFLDFLFKIIL